MARTLRRATKDFPASPEVLLHARLLLQFLTLAWHVGALNCVHLHTARGLIRAASRYLAERESRSTIFRIILNTILATLSVLPREQDDHLDLSDADNIRLLWDLVLQAGATDILVICETPLPSGFCVPF